MQGLGHLDEVVDFVGGDDLVEAADGVDAQDAAPAVVFLEGFRQHLDGFEFGDDRGGIACGHLENEARLVGDEAEELQGSGGARHGSGGQVRKVLADVRHDLGRVGEAQKRDLVFLSVAGELIEGGNVGHALAQDRPVGRDQIAHMRLEFRGLFGRDAPDAIGFEFTVQAGPQGVFHRKPRRWVKVLDRLSQQKRQRPYINLHPAGMSHRYESDRRINVQRVGERHQFVVHQRPEIGQAGRRVRRALQQFPRQRLGGTGHLAVVLKGNDDGLFHEGCNMPCKSGG